ncbi:hypothetical protein J41TS12_10670 [Paenibacillus antibioticophila]|uniref:Uncharacterized protein n=1 Tax=Paenibacillus antibioticophila TaxID=1274374 RepID=A0A920CDT2_9BACL|nr:hypothetical protein [Paenibacillus antibioticophila]GIO36206.1 hypothetical protein J41TS12_10670 [Paenibacillus antibioticophila]
MIPDMVALRRKHVAWNISQNPTQIVIHRREKIRKGGGHEEVESDLSPVTVRIFVARTQVPQTVSVLAGTKQTDKMYSLLADEHADIKAGPNVTDRFEAFGETFEVVSVQPQRVQGVTVGYQADLERVK